MKILKLFNDYKPHLKCGAELPVGALITGGTGLLGSALSSSQSSSNVQSQLAAQSAENQKNRDWQTAEAEKARQWQQNILGQQNQFQSQLQQQSYQQSLGLQAQQAKYQSPVYMRKQLEEAGLNPQVYFGQSAAFSGSSASAGGSPSAPSAPSAAQVGSVGGLNPVGFQPFGTSIGSIVSGLGSALHSAAEARKLGIESDWLPQMLRAQVRNLNKDSDLKTILKVGQDIHNEIDKAKMPYALRQAEAELYKALSEIDLNSQKTLTEQSQQQLNRAIEGVQNAIKALNEKEAEKLGLEMPFVVSLIKSKIGDLQASAEEKKQSAEQSAFFNQLYKEPDVRKSLCKELRLAGEAAERANEISKEQANMLRGQIEMLEKATSNYEIQMWSGIINQTINTAANAIGEFTRFGLTKKFLSKPSAGEDTPMEYWPGTTTRGQRW